MPQLARIGLLSVLWLVPPAAQAQEATPPAPSGPEASAVEPVVGAPTDAAEAGVLLGAPVAPPEGSSTVVTPNIIDQLSAEPVDAELVHAEPVDAELVDAELVDAELVDEGVEVGRELSTPVVDAGRVERLLAGIEAQRFALRDDRGGANLEMAVAVNLYVGGVMLSVLSVSLLLGAIFEGVCINGNVDECTDGPGFIAGMIPATIGAVALLVGASFTERSANIRHQDVDRREDGLDEVEDRVRRRNRLASSSAASLRSGVSLALGPGVLRLSF